MNKNAASQLGSPTVLVVSKDRAIPISDSLVIASLNQVYISISEAAKILAWVQQHQPDLIVLDIGWSQIIKLQLITALRLDWLTRNIPIIVITNNQAKQIDDQTILDCDAFLVKPYAIKDLEQTICSLISTPACQKYPALRPI
ncbi:MAG: response regulator [Cyanobacteria bacterium P01_G01_bin.39]